MKLWHFLSALLAAISAAVSFWAGAQLYESAYGYTWQEVTGKIVASEIRSKQMPSWRREKYSSYWPEIRYEYAVNGKTIVGDRVWFALNGSGKEETHLSVARYPVGKAVSVFVNPNNPTEAVLERGFWWPLIPMFVVALFLTLGASWLIYFDVRGYKEQKR